MRAIKSTSVSIVFSCFLPLVCIGATNTNTLIALSPYSLNTNQFDATRLPLTITNIASTNISGLDTNSLNTNAIAAIITNIAPPFIDSSGFDHFLYRETYKTYDRSTISGYGDNCGFIGTETASTATTNQTFSHNFTVNPALPGHTTYGFMFGNTEHVVGNLKRIAWCGTMTTNADARIWLGVSDQFDTAFENILDTDGSTSYKFIAFRWSSNVPDTTWKLVISDGVTLTTTNTGVALQTNAASVFEIRFGNNISRVSGYINGNLVAVVTNNLPAATNLFYMAGGVKGLNSKVPTFRFSYYRTLARAGF
jgi:hypothetical protein